MQPTQKPYRPGQWTATGVILGTFLGILFDKLALGMIFGFFIGIMIEGHKRKSATAPEEKSSND